jgi:hypothetical protein
MQQSRQPSQVIVARTDEHFATRPAQAAARTFRRLFAHGHQQRHFPRGANQLAFQVLHAAGIHHHPQRGSRAGGPGGKQWIRTRAVELATILERFQFRYGVLGAMPTLVVGMFPRENRYMATQAWPWHPLHRR